MTGKGCGLVRSSRFSVPLAFRSLKAELQTPTGHGRTRSGSLLGGGPIQPKRQRLGHCNQLLLGLAREWRQGNRVPMWSDFGFRVRTSDLLRISTFGLRISFCRLRHALANAHLLCLALALVSGLSASGCRRDMFQQPYSKPLTRSDFFQDNHMASRPLVAHTVARGQLDEDTVFYTGKTGTNLVESFPIPITRDVLERGRERFEINCAPCHGRTGDGNGMVVQRGFPPPPSYHIDRLREAPVGHFYDVITQGYGVMYSYAERVTPADRWAIAAYIRALQLSQHATLAEVPPDQRTELEASR
jgi:cytochrome c553